MAAQTGTALWLVLAGGHYRVTEVISKAAPAAIRIFVQLLRC
jgi:hypothetical protein